MEKYTNIFNRFGTIFILLFLILVVTIINPDFIQLNNILNILQQVSINGLIALGMTFVILTGGIDLSVGSTLGLTGMVLGILIVNGVNEILAIILVLILGAILGLANGLLISKLNLQPFIVTLATMTMYRGITLIISDGIPVWEVTKNAPIVDFFSQGRIMNIPFPSIIFIVVFLILMLLLQNTVFGKGVYAIGGNEEVARLSSVPTTRVKSLVYLISGAMSALAGIILTSRLSSAQPTAGQTYEMDAIAAVVIGGTSLAGGRGRILGTLIGVLIIGVINNGLNIIGVSAFYQQFIKGLIIILAVILDRKNNK